MNIPKTVQQALDTCGKPWSIEEGKKHLKIRVDGKFVAIMPLCGKLRQDNRRGELNILTQIRRAGRCRAKS